MTWRATLEVSAARAYMSITIITVVVKYFGTKEPSA